jgi:hypothetical protein
VQEKTASAIYRLKIDNGKTEPRGLLCSTVERGRRLPAASRRRSRRLCAGRRAKVHLGLANGNPDVDSWQCWCRAGVKLCEEEDGMGGLECCAPSAPVDGTRRALCSLLGLQPMLVLMRGERSSYTLTR